MRRALPFAGLAVLALALATPSLALTQTVGGSSDPVTITVTSSPQADLYEDHADIAPNTSATVKPQASSSPSPAPTSDSPAPSSPSPAPMTEEERVEKEKKAKHEGHGHAYAYGHDKNHDSAPH